MVKLVRYGFSSLSHLLLLFNTINTNDEIIFCGAVQINKLKILIMFVKF
jgi:hypothetical protein